MWNPTTHPCVRLALLALFAVAAPAARSQAVPETTTATHTWNDPAIATLMLVEDLGHAEARAVVIRRPGDMPNNIILVTRSTTPADLATAVSALIASRRNRGDQVDREIRALIGATPVGPPPARATRSAADSGGTGRARARPSPSAALAASDLARLRAAPAFAIPGIGHGPALVIRMRDRTKSTAG